MKSPNIYRRLWIFLAGTIILAGNGCSSTPIVQSIPVPSSIAVATTSIEASTTVNISTTSIITTSTISTSLIDKPVSQWPRYEFKELNFSIQLPFKRDRLNYEFHDCLKPEDRCDGTDMYWYGSSIQGEDGKWHSFAGTHSENFSYGRESSIADITDLIPGKNPKLVFPGYEKEQSIEINILQELFTQGRSVYIFDFYKNFYSLSELQPFNEFGAVFKLPFNKKFKAVVLSFNPEIIPYKFIPTIIKTIRFSKKDYFANEESQWPRYAFKELGFSLQLPFPRSSISSSEYRCDQDTDEKETICSPDPNYKKYTGSFNLPHIKYDFLTAESDTDIIPLNVIKTKDNPAVFLVTNSIIINKEPYEQSKIALLIPLTKDDYKLATIKFNTSDISPSSLKKVAESIQMEHPIK